MIVTPLSDKHKNRPLTGVYEWRKKKHLWHAFCFAFKDLWSRMLRSNCQKCQSFSTFNPHYFFFENTTKWEAKKMWWLTKCWLKKKGSNLTNRCTSSSTVLFFAWLILNQCHLTLHGKYWSSFLPMPKQPLTFFPQTKSSPRSAGKPSNVSAAWKWELAEPPNRTAAGFNNFSVSGTMISATI